MACSSCDSGGCGTSSSGCGKSGGCSSGGCNRLNTFDWLGNMELASAPSYNIVEIRFKGGRKEFFRNSLGLELFTGDPVVVEVPNGHHVGYVSMQGELVRLQMKKKNVVEDENIKEIYRIATPKDVEKFEMAKKREMATLFRTRQIIDEQKLEMKLSDVEYQADNTKATFFYSAEDRVDFRELIKVLAGEFKIRVEMKQISLRQEAGRLGGIGSCGRELCCSTWLSDFKSVSTSAARYQNLSLNPAKLSGQCGRLKCCLNYELETYVEALKDIPTIEDPLITLKGEATLQKTDIFRKIMWFGYNDESNWLPLTAERVNEILELNKKGIHPANLDENEESNKGVQEAIQEKNELSRFDEKFNKSAKKKKKKKKKPRPDSVAAPAPVNGAPKVNPAPINNKPNNNNNKPNNSNNKPNTNNSNSNSNSNNTNDKPNNKPNNFKPVRNENTKK